MSDSFVSPEPVAYCIETPLHGWEIASPARAAAEPELRWKKMVVLTDAERYAAMAGLRSLERALYADPENLSGEYRDMQQDAATLRGLLERHAKGGET